MSIPNNISKEHLLKAIEKINNEGIPVNSDSQYYDVIYNAKKYPPKVIVSYANIFANGIELDRTTFSGGLETQCFKLLEVHGFKIKKKEMSYYNELVKFITVSDKQVIGQGTVGVQNFNKEKASIYGGLKIEAKFGTGRASAIPWIAFLSEQDSVQDGIYPVYLYYKEKNILILAYGLSETNKPKRTWNLQSKKTIKEYFSNNNLGVAEKYGSSFVFKVYNINKPLNEKEIDEDLNKLISIYKETPKISQTSIKTNVEFRFLDLIECISNTNLNYSRKLLTSFTASLLTKPFVILTGLSGSGKTKLAQAFAMWICEKDEQYCIVAVGADWTNREPLLGFPNALIEGDYKKDEYGVLKLIIDANTNSDKPYFLILDEMNLSHVERYFADFLSVMESKSEIALHSGNEDWNNVPAKIGFPKNLFIIGTVNIDETTYMFSPKVLDRANVIEFRVTKEEMENYLQSNSVINLENLEGLCANMAGSFVEIAKDESLKALDTDELKKSLMSFFSELKKTGAEFGYRNASEILRFAAVVNKIEPAWSMTDIIDAAIMQKLLPKVHGSRRKLEPVLKTLGQLCLQDGQKFDDLLLIKTELDFKDVSKIKYPVSLEKIIRMYDNLISNGFTSYAEA